MQASYTYLQIGANSSNNFSYKQKKSRFPIANDTD